MKRTFLLITLLGVTFLSFAKTPNEHTFFRNFDFKEVGINDFELDPVKVSLSHESCTAHNQNKGFLYDVNQAEINAVRDVEEDKPKLYFIYENTLEKIIYPAVTSTQSYINIDTVNLTPTLNCGEADLSKMQLIEYAKKYNESLIQALHFKEYETEQRHAQYLKTFPPRNDDFKEVVVTQELIEVKGVRAIIESSVDQKRISDIVLGTTEICDFLSFNNKGLLYDASYAEINAQRDLLEGRGKFYGLLIGSLGSLVYPKNENQIHSKGRDVLHASISITVKCNVDITNETAASYVEKYNNIILKQWDKDRVLKWVR